MPVPGATFCSPNDPVPGSDFKLSDVAFAKRPLKLGDLILTFNLCRNASEGQRLQHGMVTFGNRLDLDVSMTIGGGPWKLVLGTILSGANSHIFDLENNRYAYLKMTKGRTTFFVSNDVYISKNDQSYSGVFGLERRQSFNLGDLHITGGRVRAVGTTGIPNRQGPTVLHNGRPHYGGEKYFEAKGGFLTIDLEAIYRQQPITFSMTYIDDTIREYGQGFLHRIQNIHEFLPNSLQGFFFQVSGPLP